MDTSPSRKVNSNLLLSASVTGLTFDDFSNKLLILPAAPPVNNPAPSSLATGPPHPGNGRESIKSLVTVGNSSYNDLENLDEINLNTTPEESQPTQIDTNANSLLEQNSTANNESILSQAASSFSALPSVASSVFSTFSKRIYSGSTSRELTPVTETAGGTLDPNANPISQLDIQPAYIQQQEQPIQPYTHSEQIPGIAAPPPPFYAPQPPPPTGISYFESTPTASLSQLPVQPPLEPPKFYKPAEAPTLPTLGGAPTSTVGQNTYRLLAKKKIYAPIPGLSDQTRQAPILDTSAVSAPFDSNSQYQQRQANLYDYPTPQTQYPAQLKPEERKSGLFSLSNLVPTGVFQNLSGLVQSATGTLTQSAAKSADSAQLNIPEYPPNPYQQHPQSVGGQLGGANYFGISGTQAPNAPVPTSFYPITAEPPKQPTAETTDFFTTGAVPYPHQSLGGLPPLPPTQGLLNPVSATDTLQNPTASGLPVPPPPTVGFITTSSKIGVRSDLVNQLPPTHIFDPSKETTSQSSAAFFQTQPSSEQAAFPVAGKVSQPTIQASPTPLPAPGASAETINSQAQLTGVGFFHPTPATEALFNPTLQPSIDISTPAVAIFNPTQQSGNSPAATHFVPAQQSPVGILPSVSLFNSAQQPPVEISAPSVALCNPDQTTSAGFAAFDPSLPPLHTPVVGSQQPPPLTPIVGSQQPPPSIGGQTSFRLQKGTRLYKNPLTTAETAPTYARPPLGPPSALASTHHSQTVFNPFAPPTTAFSATESVELFAPGESNSGSETGKIPLFAPTEKLTDLSAGSLELKKLIEEKETPRIASTEPHSVELFASSTVEVKSKGLSEFLTPIVPILEPEAQQPITTNTESTVTSFELQTIEAVVPFEEKHVSINSKLDPPLDVSIKEAIVDPLEQTLQKLSLASTEANTGQLSANFLPPPPHSSTTQGAANPYRRDLVGTHTLVAHQPPTNLAPTTLANFFTPALDGNTGASGDFNFFATQTAIDAVLEPSKPALDSALNSFFNVSQSTAQTAQSPFANTANLFAGPQVTEVTSNILQQSTEPCLFPVLPPLIGIAPLPLTQELQLSAEATTPSEFGIALAPHPPPLGFDKLVTQTVGDVAAAQSLETTQPLLSTVTPKTTLAEQVLTQPDLKQVEKTSSVNSFSNYFNTASISNLSIQQQQQVLEKEQQKKLSDPFSFFDSFAPQAATAPPAVLVVEDLLSSPTKSDQQPQTQSNEDQRIQNFFNNPPPKENSGGIGDLNYDLVHSGLGVRNQLQQRSLTPASNLVEPPSSSCSEFSELNNSSSAGHPKVVGLSSSVDDNTVKASGIAAESHTEPKLYAPTLDEPTLEEPTKVTPEVENYKELPDDILHALRMANLLIGEKGAASAPPATVSYSPAIKHWFYKRIVGTKHIWTPFSHYDSALLETSWIDVTPNLVAVEGGRYDVNIAERTKVPVYWEGEPIEVRRCSWFYKANDSKYIPYEEQTADTLESEYKQAAESGEWHKKIILSMGEQVVFHGPTVLVHFQQQQNVDTWGGTSQTSTRPRVVKRDLDDFIIEQGESQRVDHLLYMVHGIGSACDLKMRTVEEVVDEFRSIAQQLVSSHYKNSTDMGVVGRVEVLPISWHGHLHSVELGIDEKLKSITLESIPKLRNFTNDTLLDVLFYTSPTYCQKIMNTVAAELNASYIKYRERHPDFNGGVSLAGHSLGSLILFDLLCHQKPMKECEEQNLENPDQQFLSSQMPTTIAALDTNRVSSINEEVAAKQISYTMGPAGTGQPFIHYAQLIFQPKKFFALGSPIGMFVTIRGIDKLGLDFRLPTCPGFYNIFHPFDPVAYRIEALVNPDMSGIRPVLIPHHKGRKRMHLELKETMTRVGADLKQRFFDTFKTTIDSVNFLNTSTRSKKEAEETMEKEVDQVIQLQMQLEQQQQQRDILQQNSSSRSRADSSSTSQSDTDAVEIDFPLGKLNDSKRVDFVLQEAPLEFFNEYLFALSSHVCYWDSEDTILFVMKEIYSGLGVSPDSQVPQQTMTIERPNSRNSVSQTLLPPTI